ncbi:serine/threonine-protein kinase [Micromonospora sp. WMMD812]|uniref:protein kinase domain-containing protein n=1 Tax=Micromonospora sp. WMMD812 TaxID=3015152 RepID=UPI00248AA217|nr:serine/threonine-protein kinase [Micromonospora sp. WMMD812]WBB66908.1 serine/threonine-protein kinase [Micromonospora sp. WMMD812]
MGQRLLLASEWTLGEQVGGGGFGRVLEASSDQVPNAVAKLVPKGPGAERELLFVDLAGARNVVPIIDRGETEDNWVLVMPRAEKSLREHIESAQGRLSLAEALTILTDIATALSDLHGRVVHRDLKPENVLLLDGHWCLADFGISRYAESSTAPDTRKYSMTPPYAAPEQWRGIRATSATDVYALGVIAYELLSGNWPFEGPEAHDFREQHLHQNPELLSGVPLPIAAMIDECLYKGMDARPTPSNLLARLTRAVEATPSAGLAQLQQANLAEVNRIREEERAASEARSEEERREELAQSASRALTRMMDYLKDAILANAPAATFAQRQPAAGPQARRSRDGWTISLNGAKLVFDGPLQEQRHPWGQSRTPIDVVASAGLSLVAPSNYQGYEGRSHSLWYCDAQTAGEYHWYETAFMDQPMMRAGDRPRDPYALSPGSDAAEAIGPGLMRVQVAWPFTPLSIDAMDEFVDRWAGWLALASQGKLQRPMMMPEKQPQGSWRVR